MYDADNANEDLGAGEMDRDQVELEPTKSLAAQRVPAIARFRLPSDVPTDARAYREELLESQDWKIAEANVATAAKAVEVGQECLAGVAAESQEERHDARVVLKDAEAKLLKAKERCGGACGTSF